MAVIIGSARHDEHGNCYSGGKAGDQTGQEVSTQKFYNHSKGWYVLRAKDDRVAEKLAEAMQIASDNKNIGYDQSERYGVIKHGINTTDSVGLMKHLCLSELRLRQSERLF